MKNLLSIFILLFTSQVFAKEKIYEVQIDSYKNGKFRTSRKIRTLENLRSKSTQENHFGYQTYSEIIPQNLLNGNTLLKFETAEILPDDNFIMREDIIFKDTDFFQTFHIQTKNNNYEYIVKLTKKL